MSALSDRALELALADVGQAEEPKGSNWGPYVQACLASVGITFPAAWCMAFVYHAFSRAAKEQGIACPLVKTGGVLKSWNNAKANRVTEPQKGDIGILDHGKGLGHAVIVVDVLPGGFVSTVEGNTNDDGSREGYEVALRSRKISSFKGFLRY